MTCLSLTLSKSIYEVSLKEAVALKPQSVVRYGPSYKDQVAFKLGEGVKVRMMKRTEDWSRLVLLNGETGWIRNEEIGLIE